MENSIVTGNSCNTRKVILSHDNKHGNGMTHFIITALLAYKVFTVCVPDLPTSLP